MTLKDIVKVLWFDTRIILSDSEGEIYAGRLGDLSFQLFSQNEDKEVKNVSVTQRGDLIYEVIML